MYDGMTRRGFLSSAIGGAAVAALGGSVCAGYQRRGGGRKLNVLFIGVDDLRPQLGCYGQEHIISPNIDRLAAEGLLFERSYCQQAVCGPSRASLMTGMRPDSTGIHGNTTPVRKALPDVVTLGECFKKNGYETVSIGKIYHHSDDDMQGWSKEPFRAEGRWEGRGYLTKEAIAAMKAYGEAKPEMMGRGPAFEAADVADSEYPDGANTDHAIREMRRMKGRPFFMAMGLYKPHLPFNAPKKYWDMYKREEIRLADNPFVPKNAPTYAMTNWGEMRNYWGIPKKGPCSEELAKELIHGYYACVTYIDAQVGRLLDELDRLGLRERTVVILWGDHGWKLGEHGGWCKHTNFELDALVPMLLSVPGMKTAGRRTQRFTEHVDMYPTLCDACGLEVPGHLEGHSVMPLVRDPDRAWKKAAFSQYPRGKVMGYSMRTERYRYTEWQERESGKVVACELYDHVKDPDENVNVAGQADHSKDIERLSRMLKAGWRGALPD